MAATSPRDLDARLAASLDAAQREAERRWIDRSRHALGVAVEELRAAGIAIDSAAEAAPGAAAARRRTALLAILERVVDLAEDVQVVSDRVLDVHEDAEQQRRE